MQKKFVGNLFFVILLNILVKPFWLFGIDVAVQNRVGVEEYGFYYPIFSFSILLNIILDFGITNYNNRNIAQHSHLLGRYFSGIFNVKLLLGLVYLVITLVSAFFIGFDSRAFNFLFFLSLNQFLASIILFLRSNLSGLHLFKLDGIISISDRVLMIIICSYLLWSDRFSDSFEIEWFVYAQFIAYLITAIFTFVIVVLKARSYTLKFDWVLFRVILKQSLPFALLVVLMSFYYRLDSVMLDLLLEDGALQAGVYAQSYRILEGFNMFGYLVAALLLPIFSKMIKDKLELNNLLYTAFSLVFVPSCLVLIVSLSYPNELMELLYESNVEETATVFSVLIISFICIALTYIFGTLLTANGSLQTLNKIAFTGFLINFITNLILIPDYGAFGAALATLFTQLFVVISQLVVVKSIFNIKPNYTQILKQFFIVAILILIAYLLLQWNAHILISIITLALISLISVFGLKIIRISSIKAIVLRNSVN